MKAKIVSAISALLMIGGLLLIMGAAGGVDCNTLSLKEAVAGSLVGFGLIIGGYMGGYLYV